MSSDVIYYSLILLSIIGICIFIVCFLRITIEKIKRSKFTKNLSIFLVSYFIVSIFGLRFFDYIPKFSIIKYYYIIISLGVIFAPTTLIIVIPSNVIRFDKNINALKPYLIGLISLITSIAIWLLLHKLGYNPF